MKSVSPNADRIAIYSVKGLLVINYKRVYYLQRRCY